MARILAAIAALSVATSSAAQGVAEAPSLPQAPALEADVQVVAPPPPASHPDALVVPKDTMVRLMVLNEVNTRKARPGDRFVLRVDENVAVNGTIVIPVGAKAWGEVTDSRQNGAVGKAGQISARLLYVEAGGRQISAERGGSEQGPERRRPGRSRRRRLRHFRPSRRRRAGQAQGRAYLQRLSRRRPILRYRQLGLHRSGDHAFLASPQ